MADASRTPRRPRSAARRSSTPVDVSAQSRVVIARRRSLEQGAQHADDQTGRELRASMRAVEAGLRGEGELASAGGRRRSRVETAAAAAATRDAEERRLELAGINIGQDDDVDTKAFELTRSMGLRAVAAHDAEVVEPIEVVGDVPTRADRGDVIARAARDAAAGKHIDLGARLSAPPLQEVVGSAAFDDIGGIEGKIKSADAPADSRRSTRWPERVASEPGLTQSEEAIVKSRVLCHETEAIRRFARDAMSELRRNTVETKRKDAEEVAELEARVRALDEEQRAQKFDVHFLAAITNSTARTRAMERRKAERIRKERQVMLELMQERQKLAEEVYTRHESRQRDIEHSFRAGPLVLQHLGDMVAHSYKRLGLAKRTALVSRLHRAGLPISRLETEESFDVQHRKIVLNKRSCSNWMRVTNGGYAARNIAPPSANPEWETCVASEGPWVARRSGKHRAQRLLDDAIAAVTNDTTKDEWPSLLARVFDAVHPEVNAEDPNNNLRLQVAAQPRRRWHIICSARDRMGYPVTTTPDGIFFGDSSPIEVVREPILDLLSDINNRMNRDGRFYWEISVPANDGPSDAPVEWAIGLTCSTLSPGCVPGDSRDSFAFYSGGTAMHDGSRFTYCMDLSDESTVGMVIDLERGSLSLVVGRQQLESGFGAGVVGRHANEYQRETRDLLTKHFVPFVAIKGTRLKQEKPERSRRSEKATRSSSGDGTSGHGAPGSQGSSDGGRPNSSAGDGSLSGRNTAGRAAATVSAKRKRRRSRKRGSTVGKAGTGSSTKAADAPVRALAGIWLLLLLTHAFQLQQLPMMYVNFGAFAFLHKPADLRACDAYLHLEDKTLDVEVAEYSDSDASETKEEPSDLLGLEFGADAAKGLQQLSLKNVYVNSLTYTPQRSWSEFPQSFDRKRKQALNIIQYHARLFAARQRRKAKDADMLEAVRVIERFFVQLIPGIRGKKHTAASKIQAIFRGYRERSSWDYQARRLAAEPAELDRAATRLQLAWRMHVARISVRCNRLIPCRTMPLVFGWWYRLQVFVIVLAVREAAQIPAT